MTDEVDRAADQIKRARVIAAEREATNRADDAAFPNAVCAALAKIGTVDPRAAADAERYSRAQYLRDIGVPARVADVAAAADLEQTEAIEALRGEMQQGRQLVVLSGGVGVGKSVAAAYWLSRVSEQRYGKWVHAHEIARASGFDQVPKALDLERVGFLVLDDLGVEYLDAKGFLAATLDSLVYQRHGNRRPTVVTSNLDAVGFAARYGERIVDRIREAGCFVQVAGRSLRTAPTE